MSGVVVVGAGHAGLAAALELKAQGYAGQVTLLDRSEYAPYERPPISKVWIAGEGEPSDLFLRTPESLQESGIRFIGGTEITGIDRDRKVVHTSQGEFFYDDLVLALGATPRALDAPGRELSGIHHLHTLEQAVALRAELADAEKLVVVGGGFIGLELASTLADRMQVAVVEAAPRLMGRATSEYSSAHMRTRHEELGIEFHFGASVEGFIGENGRLTGVRIAGKPDLAADVAVLGIGVVPNGSWVAEAGLEFQDGILVDDELRTSDPHIYAIGDCARYPSQTGQAGTTRLESVGNAADHARRVAATIAGTAVPATDIPWFWTKQAGVRLQMVGHIQLVQEWLLAGDSESSAFSVIGLADDRIVYGESINRPGDHVALRKVLAADAGPLTDELKSRLGEGLRPVLDELQRAAPVAS